MNLLKKLFFAAIIFSFIMLFSLTAFCSNGMGISTKSFLNQLSYASTRVSRGFSNSQISTDIQKSDNYSAVLEYNNSLMLIVNETDDHKEIKNLAAIYILGNTETQQDYAKVALLDNDIIFENICKQVMFALDKNMTDTEAEETLKSIGLYSSVLDGFQRSSSIKGFSYIMKLQPNGVIMMVVSRI